MLHQQIIEAICGDRPTAEPRSGTWYRRVLTEDGRTLAYLYPLRTRDRWNECPAERRRDWSDCGHACRVKVIFASPITGAPSEIRTALTGWRTDAQGREFVVVSSRSVEIDVITRLLDWARDNPVARARANRPRGPRRALVLGQLVGAGLEETRRFGIEVEFFGMSRPTAERVLRETPGLMGGWRVTSDGSVTRWQGHMGMEIVSPPMRLSDDPWTQLDAILTRLRAEGGRVNRSCGVHCHLDVDSAGLDGIKRFVKLWSENADLFDWLVPTSRRRGANTYVRRWNAHYLSRLDGVTQLRELGNFHRYYNPNVVAYAAHGTVEVRQGAGTLQADKIRNWVLLCLGVMSLAVRTQNTPRYSTLDDLLSSAVTDPAVRNWLSERAADFEIPANLLRSSA